MSNWIRVTGLPHYMCCDAEVAAEFEKDIGTIKQCRVMNPDAISRTTEAFVQYKQAKHAKLAAHKKDSIVIDNRAIQVFLVWCPKETLSTIKVSNLPRNISNTDLQDEFKPWGEIVDSQISFESSVSSVGRISYTKVDYAITAVQEMNGTIVRGSDKPLKVELTNPDARNLKWKRNGFRYTKCDIPSKTVRNGSKSESVGKRAASLGNGRSHSPSSMIGFNSVNNHQRQLQFQQIALQRKQQQQLQQWQQLQTFNQLQQLQQLQSLCALKQRQVRFQPPKQNPNQKQQQQQQQQQAMDFLRLPFVTLTPTTSNNGMSVKSDMSPLSSLPSSSARASPSLQESKSLPLQSASDGVSDKKASNYESTQLRYSSVLPMGAGFAKKGGFSQRSDSKSSGISIEAVGKPILLSKEQSAYLKKQANMFRLQQTPSIQTSNKQGFDKPGLLLSTTSQASNEATVQSTPPASIDVLHCINPLYSWSEEQRMVGDALYKKVCKHSKNAGRIVGCLLHKHRNDLSSLTTLLTQTDELVNTINHCDQLLNSMRNK